VGHGLQEYTTLSNDSFLKMANCAELHTMSELEDATLTCCCSDIITLAMLEKSDTPFVAAASASCKMLEFDAETEGPGCTHAIELKPVAASTHVTFKDTVPVELKEQPSIAIWVGAALDDSTSRPADVPLES
jgi:hypothetical protein